MDLKKNINCQTIGWLKLKKKKRKKINFHKRRFFNDFFKDVYKKYLRTNKRVLVWAFLQYIRNLDKLSKIALTNEISQQINLKFCIF